MSAPEFIVFGNHLIKTCTIESASIIEIPKPKSLDKNVTTCEIRTREGRYFRSSKDTIATVNSKIKGEDVK